MVRTLEAGEQSSASIPAYPYKRSGTCLVCGFAPTLFDDLAEARALRPGASVLAVNRAATAIDAFAVFSLHHGPEKLGRWVTVQRETFGPCEVHGHGLLTDLDKKRAAYPYVDYWWWEARGTGTSAWAAAKLAKLMGFSEVILCGVLLERAPYADGSFCRDFRRSNVLKIYRDYIKGDKNWHAGIYAMSGWPERYLGKPQTKDAP